MPSYKENGLLVTPLLNNTFGAEVEGVDWTNVPLPKDVLDTLVSLQDQYAVLIFRSTGLDNDRHVAFSQQLGELETNPAWGGTQRVGTPYLFDVSNIEADGKVVKKGSRRWAHSLGNALWHTDSAFNQHRSKYSLLLAHSVPSGNYDNTFFADTRRAFADLPEERKSYLRSLIVEHELWHSRRLASPDIYKEPTLEERTAKPPAYHRFVQPTPDDNAETFFLAAHAKTLFEDDGRQVQDSQKLIWNLIEHCTKSEYTLAAEWRGAGDLMWWDNRQSMHRASPYTEMMGPRDVRRSTVKDDGKCAFGIDEQARRRLALN